ncbi:MAG TPA: isopentenyl-diphosphate Delta-isomerase [Flavobacteriales bacterium]|mgnify:CR=1 FL=1|nr:isopentenyl-diphosphate Delta-isomerase [Flavobacteriales bacterium]MCC6911970.1 isopentenyl-diphosphate Delta-isomerase [Flavobacteriales bacterium]HQX98958.1 isopentenyl-diphosphate Delta-isomerase [Flavobacteriales bacterium]
MKSDGYPFLDREMVVLIDPNDREIGQMEKLEAHRTGRLHRAFSVFIFNAQGELLLQQRAANKYHSASLWTNTCCGHPRPGEALVAAGERRLEEEMGLHVPLRPAFHFTYAAKLEDGLTEHELDHVLIGRSDRDPRPDPEEAADWRWVDRATLEGELAAHPGLYTVWFLLCVKAAWEHADGMTVQA